MVRHASLIITVSTLGAFYSDAVRLQRDETLRGYNRETRAAPHDNGFISASSLTKSWREMP